MALTWRFRGLRVRNSAPMAGCIAPGEAADTRICYNQAGALAGAGHGRLHLMPTSWLHQLIARLRPQDRLALFRVCRQLARQVVCSTPKLSLKVWQERPSKQITTSKSSIFKLLNEGRSFSVDISGQCQALMPTALGAYVTAVTVAWQGCGNWYASPAGLDLGMLPNLQELTYDYTSDLMDLIPLCGALETGSLPKLSKLNLKATSDGYLQAATVHASAWRRLASAAGPQVTHLTINDNNVLPHILHFKVLQYLELSHCTITAVSEPQHILQHPTLQDVKLVNCAINTPCMHMQCFWRSLTLASKRDLSCIPKLPIDYIGEIRILHPADEWFGYVTDSCMEVLHAKCSQRAVLQPMQLSNGGMAVAMYRPCRDLIGLLRYIRQPCRVIITVPPSYSIQVLWNVLSPYVSAMILRECGDQDWSMFWHCMPITLTHLCLDTHVSELELLLMVYTAPAHLVELHIRHSNMNVFAKVCPAGLRIVSIC